MISIDAGTRNLPVEPSLRESLPKLIAHTPAGCDTAAKSPQSTALYDHALAHMKRSKPDLEAANLIGLEDSLSGASSLSRARMKSVGFNPQRKPEAARQLYEAGAQLVVDSHERYQEVMRREASEPGQNARFPGARRVYHDPESYFADPSARLSPEVAKGAALDVDGVIFDSEPLVADAVVETLQEAHIHLSPEHETRVRKHIVGTSLPVMRAEILPSIIDARVPVDFVEKTGARIIEKYRSVRMLPGALDTIVTAVRLFGSKGVEFVSNAMPDETREKFSAAHGIAIEANHLGILDPETLKPRCDSVCVSRSP